MSITTDPAAKDPWVQPTYSVRNRLARLLWGCVYVCLFKTSPTPLYKWRSMLLRAFGGKIGSANHIYPSAKIWAPWLLSTEEAVTIAPGAEVYNPGGVHLGHHTIISQNAFLCGATHDYNSPEFPTITKPIRTEAYAWVCAHAIVLPGVSMGEGSVLGAGSVVSRNIEAWAVYAGNPAKSVKQRKPFDVTAYLKERH